MAEKDRARAAPGEGLAPLQSFAPELIIKPTGKDRLAEFILALSLVFNDLKGLLYWRELYREFAPKNLQEISARAGEFRGIDLQFHRLLLAHLFELLKLVKEYGDIAEGSAVTELLADAHPETRLQWSDLVKAALGRGTPRTKTFAKVLELTRHTVAYHYYQPGTIVSGFREWFYKTPKEAGHTVAFASVGKSMEASRFFFADAAVQGAMEKLMKDHKLRPKRFDKQLYETVNAANQAVRFLVVAYLSRDKTM